MNKLNDYRKRIQDYIASVHNDKFEYGNHDCATFACDIIFAATGVDKSEGLKNKYKTYIGGARALKKATGFSDPISYFKSFSAEIEPAFAQYGDLCYYKTNDELDQYSIGLIFGAFAVGISKNGLIRFPLSDVKGVLRYA